MRNKKIGRILYGSCYHQGALMLPEQTTQRIIDSIKPAFAVCIALGIAFYLDLERPYWAALAVVTTCYTTEGQFIQQALLLIPGTILGGVSAVILFSIFPQDPLYLFSSITVLIGVAAFLYTLFPSIGYFFFTVILVVILAAPSAIPDTQGVFRASLARTEEICLGILVYGFITILFWRKKAFPILKMQVTSLLNLHTELFNELRKKANKINKERVFSLQSKIFKTHNSAKQYLTFASMDSYDAWENKNYWQSLLYYFSQLNKAESHWAWLTSEGIHYDIKKCLPNLADKLEQLTDIISLTKKHLHHPLLLSRNEQAYQNITHAKKLQVLAIQAAFNSLANHAIAIHNYHSYLFTTKNENKKPKLNSNPIQRCLTLSSIIIPLQCMLSYSILLISWHYFYPVGHYNGQFIILGGVFSLIKMMPSGYTPLRDFILSILASAFAVVTFVMTVPHLTTYFELSIVIWCYTFFIFFFFSKPSLAAFALVAMIGWFVFPPFANVQKYNFESLINSSLCIILAFGVPCLVEYVFRYPNPKFHFVKKRDRFINQLIELLDDILISNNEPYSNAKNKKLKRKINKTVMLPHQMQQIARRLNFKKVNEPPETIQEYIFTLHLLGEMLSIFHKIDRHPKKSQSNITANISSILNKWAQELRHELQEIKYPCDEITFFCTNNNIAFYLRKLETQIDLFYAEKDNNGSPKNFHNEDNLYLLLIYAKTFSNILNKHLVISKKIKWQEWALPLF